MKKLMILTIGVCLLLTSVPAYAQSDNATQEVIKADRARLAAIHKGDGETWAQYISDGCIWANVLTGEVVANKKERVTTINERGATEPRKLTDEKLNIFSPTNVASIVVQTGLYSGTNEEGPFSRRFVRIWEKLDGRWQMIALYVARESN